MEPYSGLLKIEGICDLDNDIPKIGFKFSIEKNCPSKIDLNSEDCANTEIGSECQLQCKPGYYLDSNIGINYRCVQGI